MIIKKNHKAVSDGNRLEALLAGIPKVVSTDAVFTLGKVTYTVAQLLAKLAALNAPYVAASEAHTALSLAVHVRDQAEPETHAFVIDLEACLRAMLGSRNVELEELGIIPKTDPTLTAAEKAERAAKAKATRESNASNHANGGAVSPPAGIAPHGA